MTGDAPAARERRPRPFDPPLAAASLSGVADAEWARAVADRVGCAFLGGVSLDPASRAAARDLVARGREEFLPTDPVAFVDEQLAALAESDAGGDIDDLRPAVNLRSATPGPLGEAAGVCAEHGAIAEVNAHCRQPELCAVGCGERLLGEEDRLREHVRAAVDAGATVSVKVRAEVPGVDLPAAAVAVAEAGADAVHVDAMDSEAVVSDVVEALREWANAEPAEVERPFVIANNEVRDRATVREYLDHGADAVSVGRPTAPDADGAALDRVAAAVADLTDAEPDAGDSRRAPT
ncbi:tRNA-dihydrouridine synthase [Haloparvum sedimenti]|uniref:tRNA-dihydrouridine synthase n=1 Tax=Haloparvum sedimenti TaxID=1678448 RepID=UPI00071E8111|nr:tRNA-dihydrouridine synthase [Haloparvum sedimenti]